MYALQVFQWDVSFYIINFFSIIKLFLGYVTSDGRPKDACIIDVINFLS